MLFGVWLIGICRNIEIGYCVFLSEVSINKTGGEKSFPAGSGFALNVKPCAPTWARTRDQKIMSLRQGVKREIFLRAENFVSDLLRPIYNKVFEFPSAEKNITATKFRHFFRVIKQEIVSIYYCIWQNEAFD